MDEGVRLRAHVRGGANVLERPGVRERGISHRRRAASTNVPLCGRLLNPGSTSANGAGCVLEGMAS